MTITYGVIGTNWITGSWISGANKTGKWKLHAVYSRTAEQAQAYASQHNCSNIHTTIESLAADEGMQAVYIASPNSLHYSQAKQLLLAKKHIILEKPATSTPTELDDLFKIAKEQGVFLIEAYRHIQEANYKHLQRLITQEKRLGAIYGASLPFASYSSRYTKVLEGETSNIFSLDFSGGSLVDVGVYPVAFAVGLFGAPKSQTYAPHICRTGVDAGGVVVLQYEGFGVQINQSKAYNSTQPCEIYGEKGTLTTTATTDIRSLKLLDPRSKKTEELAAAECKTVEKPNENMEEECAEFARIIEEGDSKAADDLARISRIVLAVTSDLRRQNGILYPADKGDMK